jgi:hypothetical protein
VLLNPPAGVRRVAISPMLLRRKTSRRKRITEKLVVALAALVAPVAPASSV